MNLSTLTLPAYRQMLAGLSRQLDKAAAHGLGDEVLQKRLADDMFPLAMQVAFVCTQARELVQRLSGHPVAAFEAPTETLEAARLQVAGAIALLEGADPAALDAGADRVIELDLPNGMTFVMTGEEYVRDWAQAQFYFHLTAAYAILRNQGLPLGKADYVGHMMAYLKPRAA